MQDHTIINNMPAVKISGLETPAPISGVRLSELLFGAGTPEAKKLEERMEEVFTADPPAALQMEGQNIVVLTRSRRRVLIYSVPEQEQEENFAVPITR